MQFNNGKCFLFHHYQNKKDRIPRSMQEQSRGCRFTFPPCLYIIPRVETQVLPPRVHTRDTRYIEHHMKMIRLDGVVVWHFGGKDLFVS